MESLTDRQKTVLEFVERHSRDRGFPPTMREVGEALGLPNVSAVRGHLEALEKKGYIARDSDKARTIRVLRSPSLMSLLKRGLHRFAGTDVGVVHRVIYAVAAATRGRRAVFEGPARQRMLHELERRAVEHGWEFLSVRLEPDHVCVDVQVWPNHSPELVVQRIKSAGLAAARGRTAGGPGRLWAPGYAATTEPPRLPDLLRLLLHRAASPEAHAPGPEQEPQRP